MSGPPSAMLTPKKVDGRRTIASRWGSLCADPKEIDCLTDDSW